MNSPAAITRAIAASISGRRAPIPGLRSSIGIGVFDTNLAPFGIRMSDDEEAARRCAERFCDVAGPYLAG